VEKKKNLQKGTWRECTARRVDWRYNKAPGAEIMTRKKASRPQKRKKLGAKSRENVKEGPWHRGERSARLIRFPGPRVSRAPYVLQVQSE